MYHSNCDPNGDTDTLGDFDEDSHRYLNPPPDGYCHALTDPDQYRNRYSNAVPNIDENTNQDANSKWDDSTSVHPDPYSNRYGHLDPNRDRYSHLDPHGDCYSHLDPHCDLYGHPEPDGDCHGDTESNRYRFTESNRNPDSVLDTNENINGNTNSKRDDSALTNPDPCCNRLSESYGDWDGNTESNRNGHSDAVPNTDENINANGNLDYSALTHPDSHGNRNGESYRDRNGNSDSNRHHHSDSFLYTDDNFDRNPNGKSDHNRDCDIQPLANSHSNGKLHCTSERNSNPDSCGIGDIDHSAGSHEHVDSDRNSSSAHSNSGGSADTGWPALQFGAANGEDEGNSRPYRSGLTSGIEDVGRGCRASQPPSRVSGNPKTMVTESQRRKIPQHDKRGDLSEVT